MSLVKTDDGGLNPMFTYITTTGAILFGMINGADIIMFLQGLSLVGASCVAFVTFYEKVTGNTRIMAYLSKCMLFLACVVWHIKLCWSIFVAGVKWSYKRVFKNKRI